MEDKIKQSGLTKSDIVEMSGARISDSFAYQIIRGKSVGETTKLLIEAMCDVKMGIMPFNNLAPLITREMLSRGPLMEGQGVTVSETFTPMIPEEQYDKAMESLGFDAAAPAETKPPIDLKIPGLKKASETTPPQEKVKWTKADLSESSGVVVSEGNFKNVRGLICFILDGDSVWFDYGGVEHYEVSWKDKKYRVSGAFALVKGSITIELVKP